MRLLGLIGAAWAVAWAAAGQVISTVEVVSVNEVPVDPSAVLSAMQSRPGGTLDWSRVARDTRELERTGRFSQVRIRGVPSGQDQIALRVEVEPKRSIETLEIVGADEMGNRKVREWLGLGVGDMVDDAALAAAAVRVREEYAKRHYPYAQLTWTIQPGSTPGAAHVRVKVHEGPRARVNDIQFFGNTAVDADQLRQQMQQKRYRWYNPIHWFTEAGRLDEDTARTDRLAIQRLYQDRGYLDVDVRGPAIVSTRVGRVQLKYVVVEGRPYRIRSVALEGVTKFSTNEIWKVLRLSPGQVASMAALEDARDAILDYYGNRGYGDARVRWTTETHPDTAEVDVRFMVVEGEPVRIRDIQIRGNAITKEQVIRRELLVAPGELYHRTRLKTSESRVRNLGYFSNVALTLQPTSQPGYEDVIVEVTEDRMGTAEAGVAFSSIDRIVGRVEIGHGNVDLTSWPPLGGGQKLRIGGLFGSRRQDYYLTFVEPYFLDRKLRLTLDLFSRESRYFSSLYDVIRRGGRLELEQPIGRYEGAGISYNLEWIKLSNVDPSASDEIRAEAGSRYKSSVELFARHDTRNNFRIPTRGNYTRASLEVAGGPFGGDTEWYRLELKSSQYIPTWRSHVLILRGQVGYMDTYGDTDRIPLFDRYFLGGLYTVRAFRYRRVGPVDATGEPIGGASMAFASAEYTIPVYKMVRIAVFWDGGMVWSDPWQFDLDWNSGYGIGLRLDIPMLPIRIDYAWQLKSEPYNRDDNGRFNISFGYPF